MLLKIFEKHRLPMDAYHICLRSAPTLPLSLNQPVKHLLLNDLIVTGKDKRLCHSLSLTFKPREFFLLLLSLP